MKGGGMRFSVGYQLPGEDDDALVEIVADYLDHITEVYFPWADQPSGRAPLSTSHGYTDWTAQERLEADLRAFREMGIRLDLLFNANCYGGAAISRRLANQVRSVIDHLGEVVGGVDVVTTTSPFVAHTIKSHYPDIEVRASVNMRLGTVIAMQQMADLFDSYHVQRDYNRDLDHLAELKSWADSAGKRLVMLANSGCLAFCAGQSFHDNMVAHECEIDAATNVTDWIPHTCWRLMRDPTNWPMLLQSTWVRPEDLHYYESLFDVVKLATRMHARPRMVVDAYARGVYRGNLLDLLEPGLGLALAPHLLDNQRFPADWFERTSRCDRRCHTCNYCAEVLEQVTVTVG